MWKKKFPYRKLDVLITVISGSSEKTSLFNQRYAKTSNFLVAVSKANVVLILRKGRVQIYMFSRACVLLARMLLLIVTCACQLFSLLTVIWR